MTINLAQLTIAELEALAVQVQEEITAKKARAKQTLLADLERVVRDSGFSLAEIFSESVVKAKKLVVPKYRNPNNPSQTWSGRGRQPLWLVGLLAEGNRLEDLVV
ncbi:UNVERIFIED_CONTAM: hvrA [Trichonephila clavipes]